MGRRPHPTGGPGVPVSVGLRRPRL